MWLQAVSLQPGMELFEVHCIPLGFSHDVVLTCWRSLAASRSFKCAMPGVLRYAEDKQKAKAQYEAIGKLLDAQCESNRRRNAEEVAQHQEEIDRLKAKWAADDAAARQAELSARARQQQLNVEVKEFNRCSVNALLVDDLGEIIMTVHQEVALIVVASQRT